MSKRGFDRKKEVGRISLRVYLLLFLIICLSSTVFGTLNVSLSDQGTGVTDKVTGELLASGDLTVEIYDALTGGSLVYNETFENAIVNGSWNVMVGENASNPLALEYGKVYYRDYSINSEDVSFTNLTGDVVERQFFYSPLGDVGGEDLADSAVTSSKLEQSINLSNATGYLWDNLFGIPLTFPSSTDKAADGSYLYNDTSTIYLNESQLNLTISAEASVYNDTAYVNSQLTNYYGKTEVYNKTESDDRYLQNETDPVFLIENLSLWTEALNKFNSTYDTWSYNQTQPAIDYANAQGYLTSISWLNVVFMNETFLNNTYLLKGENETDGSVSWDNVVFMNETFLNDTYLLYDENASIWTAIFNRLTSTELNASYLLKGENETSIFLPTNVVFMNESLLNDTYLLKGENETSDSYNATYDTWAHNQTQPAIDYVNAQGYLVNGSNAELGTLNITGDIFLPANSLGGCSGKLITSLDGNITCGVDATGGSSDYTNIAMTNQSNTFSQPQLVDNTLNITSDLYLSVFGLANCNGKLITDASGNITCGTDQTSAGGMDYTNVAMTNESNVFISAQTIEGSANISGDVFLPARSLASCSGKLITSANGNVTCGTDESYNQTYDTWAYNQTQPAIDYVNAQGYLSNESDPLFVGENSSLWSETQNKYNQTYDTWSYNQTTPAIAYADANFITSTNLNVSYLLVGENETLGSYNSTYDTWAYNQTEPAISYVNSQGFLTNGSSPEFSMANVTGDIFLSIPGLGGCSGKLITSGDGNVTCGTDETYNQTYDTYAYNQTTPAIDYVNGQGFLTNESDPLFVDENLSLWTEALNKFNQTYDTWSYNQTTPAIDYVNSQGFLVNGSNVDLGTSNVTGDIFLSSQSLLGCSGKLITSSDGNVSCGTDQTSTGGMDYTNVAMTNQSNTFITGQTIDNTSAVTSYLNISDGTTPKFIVDPASNVGIGITPAAPLDVNAVSSDALVVNLRTAGTIRGSITLDTTNTIISSNATNNLALATATSGTSILIRDLTGNVGINNTDPKQTLSVEGSANITRELYLSTDLLANCTGKLITDTYGNVTCGTDEGSTDFTNLAMTNQSNTFITGQVIDNTSAVTDAYLNISDGTSAKMIVTPDGKVGVGIGSPGAKLHLESVSTSTTAGVEVAENISMSDQGAVTTGTESTYGEYILAERLNSGGEATINLYGEYVESKGRAAVLGNVSNVYGIYADAANGNNTYGIYSTATAGFSVAKAYGLYVYMAGGPGTEYGAAFQGGNVGIGTDTPSSMLEVTGTFNATGVSGGSGLYVDSSGNVTVGASGGSFEDLIVYGNVYYDGALVAFSPMIVQSADGLPVPVCMKNAAGVWVGCMPDENNNWACSQNEECDKKLFRIEAVRSLTSQNLTGKEIDEKVDGLMKLSEKGDVEGLRREALSLGITSPIPQKASVVKQYVSKGNSTADTAGGCVCAASEEGAEETRREMEQIRAEIDLLKKEMEKLKGNTAETGLAPEKVTAHESPNPSNNISTTSVESANQSYEDKTT